jgi:hypothetical protein
MASREGPGNDGRCELEWFVPGWLPELQAVCKQVLGAAAGTLGRAAGRMQVDGYSGGKQQTANSWRVLAIDRM